MNGLLLPPELVGLLAEGRWHSGSQEDMRGTPDADDDNLPTEEDDS